ncbi:MAG TPA: hypothetical protein VJ767_12340 [Nitrososphaeraceae archaeon]|nr:hypothetical protein [Nitrososphaeraceae archaeon]
MSWTLISSTKDRKSEVSSELKEWPKGLNIVLPTVEKNASVKM